MDMFTADEIALFPSMTRSALYEMLSVRSPETAKGKSRAKKEEIITMLAALKRDEVKREGLEPGELAITHAYPSKGHSSLTAQAIIAATPREGTASNEVQVAPSQVHDPKGPWGRKDVVLRKLSGLTKEQALLLYRYKNTPEGNRLMRRSRDAMAKRIRKFLPSDVGLGEAVAAL